MSTTMEAINAENRKRKAEGSDSPFKRLRDHGKTGDGVGGDDYIHYGTGMQLPYLPYSFTSTCAFCGKTGVMPDARRSFPLKFLGEYLRYACARTPFVYNILYQMAHYTHLEVEEVTHVCTLQILLSWT